MSLEGGGENEKEEQEDLPGRRIAGSNKWGKLVAASITIFRS